jgi:Protein of unknown function (DUF2975)
MEPKKRTKLIITTMNVLFWIIYIGLCIKTGAILISFFVSLAINSAGASNLYEGLNLSALYKFSTWHYTVIVASLILLTGLKAYIACLVVKISLHFNINQPFSAANAAFINRISDMALATGVLAVLGTAHSKYLMERGIDMPLNWAAGELLFLAGVIFIIAQVFKRGIAIQTENELTV